MAYLKIVAGSVPGQVIELTEDQVVLGRHPTSQVVLDNAAVSRHHARILLSHGRFYLEDLRSRNGTLLNDEAITGRAELNDFDEIDICEVVLKFFSRYPTEAPDEPSDDDFELNLPKSSAGGSASPKTRIEYSIPKDEGNSSSIEGSSIITTLETAGSGIDSDFRVSVNAEAKLRGVIEIGQALSGILDVDQALEKTLFCLFRMFPQTDVAFAMLIDDETQEPEMRAIKTKDDRSAGEISMTIVRQAIAERSALLTEDAQQDKRFDTSESLAGTLLRSLMCVPLINSEKAALGVLHLATHSIAQPFTQDDLDLVVSIAGQTAMAIDNAHLHHAVLLQRDLQRDLEYATQIQLGFLPKDRPSLEEYEFYDYYEAAQSVGGDYFDYIPLPRGRLAFSIADVAGKGVAAALLMARLYSATRYHLLTQANVNTALNGLNGELATSGVGHRFVTCILAILNPATNQIRIANAGHMPPLLRKADGSVDSIGQKTSGLPLGVEPDQSYSTTEFTLEPGESLLLFTDGVTEASTKNGDLFGLKRLKEAVQSGPAQAESLVRTVLTQVEEFSDEDAFSDDLCIVCLHRKK